MDDVAMQALVWLCMVWFRVIQFGAVQFSALYVNLRWPHIIKSQISRNNLVLLSSNYGKTRTRTALSCSNTQNNLNSTVIFLTLNTTQHKHIVSVSTDNTKTGTALLSLWHWIAHVSYNNFAHPCNLQVDMMSWGMCGWFAQCLAAICNSFRW